MVAGICVGCGGTVCAAFGGILFHLDAFHVGGGGFGLAVGSTGRGPGPGGGRWF